MDERICSDPDCDRPAHGKLMVCKKHYNKQWRERQGPCIVDGCPRTAGQRKMCPAHYRLWRTGEDWNVPIRQNMKRDGFCARDGCSEPVQARGYCSMHYGLLFLTGDVGPAEHRKAKRGDGNISKGYHYITVDGHRIAEHRLIMEQMIGRPLYPFETPHHKNGRRADNRPENLELWTRPQPRGQRVEDLVAWVIEHYPAEVRKAIT